ncbi:MAG: GNAT family N-acetyltransferase [Vicinamibacterales bacterium]|jgi:GNAT superfamily N-acetyltransferase
MGPFKYRTLDFASRDEIAWAARVYCESPGYWDKGWQVSSEGLKNVEATISASQASSESLLLVVESPNAQLVGFHWLVIEPRGPKVAKYSGYHDGRHQATCARRVSLWVNEDCWNSGIATELMSRGEQWARDKGAEKISVTVHSNNTQMLAMNGKRGFVSTMIEMSKDLRDRTPGR